MTIGINGTKLFNVPCAVYKIERDSIVSHILNKCFFQLVIVNIIILGCRGDACIMCMGLTCDDVGIRYVRASRQDLVCALSHVGCPMAIPLYETLRVSFSGCHRASGSALQCVRPSIN